METILKLISEFEKRNNMSVSLTIHSDGSGMLEEFWDREELFQFDGIIDLCGKLSKISYELDESGRSYSPVRLINPSPNGE